MTFEKVNRFLAKLGDDGFSLVLFGTKVADSKEFCKKFNKTNSSKITKKS